MNCQATLTQVLNVSRNKTEVTARNSNGHIVKRNLLHFKRMPKPSAHTDEDSDEYKTAYSDNIN